MTVLVLLGVVLIVTLGSTVGLALLHRRTRAEVQRLGAAMDRVERRLADRDTAADILADAYHRPEQARQATRNRKRRHLRAIDGGRTWVFGGALAGGLAWSYTTGRVMPLASAASAVLVAVAAPAGTEDDTVVSTSPPPAPSNTAPPPAWAPGTVALPDLPEPSSVFAADATSPHDTPRRTTRQPSANDPATGATRKRSPPRAGTGTRTPPSDEPSHTPPRPAVQLNTELGTDNQPDDQRSRSTPEPDLPVPHVRLDAVIDTAPRRLRSLPVDAHRVLHQPPPAAGVR